MKLVKDGFGYLEAPRWHDGALWFSDIKAKQVCRMNAAGVVEQRWTVSSRPSGLGFTPAGELLVVSMEDSRLLRLAGSSFVTVADLAAIAMHPNDMVVDHEGRAYISQFGYDLFGGGDPAPTGLLVVEPDGACRTEGGGMVFPNGLDITADGRTLIVAESFGYKLSAFPIGDGGTLGRRRDFAVFDDPARDVLDGMCVDAEGAVWVGCPFANEFRRVDATGQVVQRVAPAQGGTYCVACALGGDDLRTLYMLIADTDVERLANNWDSSARVEAVRVDVPGVAQRSD